jgi:flagellar motor switch protein FliN
MSDILSNEQIDHLLSASGLGKTPVQTDTAAGGYFEKICSVFCRQMSSVVTTVLSKKIVLEVQQCGQVAATVAREAIGGESLCLALPYANGFTGAMYLIMKKKDAGVVCDLMMMGEGNADYVPEHNDAVLELSNQIASSFALALSGEIGMQVAMSPSSITVYPADTAGATGLMTAKLRIEGKADTTIALLVPDSLYQQMVQPNVAGPAAGSGADPSGSFSDGHTFDSTYQEAAPAGRNQKENIDLLLDVDLDVSIELGRATLSIKRILELAPGSIVELDRIAGEPVDLLVNDKVVAKGEVVVIDESFGIRIISLVSPEERIKSLR